MNTLDHFKKIFISCVAASYCLSSFELAAENLDSLKRLEKGFAYVAEQASPAVVSIEVRALRDAQSPFGRHPFFGDDNFFGDDFLEQFFGLPPRDKERGRGGHDRRRQQPQQSKPQHMQPIGRGSGAIVSADGYVLTNHHVIKEAGEIVVSLNDGREFTATVIGSDASSDIAVVKIDEKDLPFIALGNSDDLAIGEWVVAIGNPMGLQTSVTAGIVSAKGRNNLNITDFGDLIQTDAAINPGNSGGPLLNLNGEIVGINTAIMSTSGGYMGIGFAVPSKIAKYIMDQLIRSGEVTRGFLGVALQDMDKELAAAFGLQEAKGALINDIVPNSPAEKSGLLRGDVVLTVNGKSIQNAASMVQEVGMLPPGSKVVLKLFRKGKEAQVTVEIAERSKMIASSDESLEKLGIEVGPSNEKGVLVSRVERGSVAMMAGIQEGSLILSVNRKEVNSPEEFYAELNTAIKDKKVLFLLQQGNVVRFVHLKI